MLCEDCGCNLFLNSKRELECQHCGKIAEDVIREMIEELLHEKANL